MNFRLECKEFKANLIRVKNKNNGVQYIFKFENNYGASVVKSQFSYGSDLDRWELAVLEFDGYKGELVYDTPITCDVEGYLTDKMVCLILEYIRKLDTNGQLPEDEEAEFDETYSKLKEEDEI